VRISPNLHSGSSQPVGCCG